MNDSSTQEIMEEDPSKAFLGVCFVLCGFDPVKKEQVLSKLLDRGGVDVGRYCPDCTHVIVDKVVYDDPICVSARRDGKTLVTSLWVDHSFEVGMAVDHTSILYTPLRDLNGIPGAKSLTICLTGYLRQDRDDIMTMVGLMGANFSKPLVATKVTHLICYKFEGEKYELAKRMMRIKTVNHRWLEDCLKSWILLPETDYDKSGYELEMMEAEAKDSEDEQEDIPAQSYGERKLVTTPHSIKSTHQSLLKQHSPKLTTSNIAASPQNTKTPLQSFIKQGLFQDINMSASRALSDQNMNKLLSSAGKGSKPTHVSGFEQTRNRDAEMTDAQQTIISSEKHAVLLLNDNALESGTTSTRQTHPDVSISCQKTFSRKSLSKSSHTMEEEKGNGERHNNGQNLGLLDIEHDGLHSVGADAHTKVAPSLGNEQSSILPEKRTLATPSSSSKMQKKTHLQKTRKGSGLIASGVEVLGAVPRTDGNSPSRGTVRSLDTMNTLDPTNSSSVKICNTVTPDTTGQICSKEALDTGLTETMRLKRACIGSSEHGYTDVEVQEKELQGIKVTSPGSRMETENFNEFADFELPKGGKSKLQSRMPGKRRLSTMAEKSKQTFGEGSARNQMGEPATYSTGGEEIKNNEKLISEKVEVPAMHNADISKLTGKSKSFESKAEQMGHLFDETESPDDKEEDELNVTVPRDKSNAIESPHSVDKATEKEDNMCKTDYHPAENGALKAIVVRTDSNSNDAEVKLLKDSKSTKSKSKKVIPNAKKPTKSRETTQKKGIISGKSKSNTIESPHLVDKATEKEDNMCKTDYHPAENGALKAIVDHTDSNNNDAEVKLMNDSKSTKSNSKKVIPNAKKPTKSRETTQKKGIISRKSKRGAGKQIGPASGTLEGVNITDSNQVNTSMEAEKENIPAVTREQHLNCEIQGAQTMNMGSFKKPCKSNEGEHKGKVTKELSATNEKQELGEMLPVTCKKPNLQVETEKRCFLVCGHRLQRKEFQQVIKRLKGRSCRDSHQWSYQATHFIVPDPVRRTEKFFAAAASGRWILKVDYLTACNEAGKFLPEEPYEWHKKGLSEDLAISLEAPRKWRLLRQRTGHGAFYGMRIVTYGELVLPSLDTFKRVVKAGDGTILATSPPYTRFLKSDVDFAIVGQGMPRQDVWIQEFLSHKIPCVSADYLVEYVCKPGYSLDKHIQYNTHAWAEESLKKLVKRSEEVEDATPPESDNGGDTILCKVCNSGGNAGEAMLICGGSSSGTTWCGVGIHIGCCTPPLEDVPKEGWICSECNKQKKSGSTKRTSKSKRKR